MIGFLATVGLGYLLGVQKQVKKDVADRQAAGLPLPAYRGGVTKDWRALLGMHPKASDDARAFTPALPAAPPQWSALPLPQQPQPVGNVPQGDFTDAWGPANIVGSLVAPSTVVGAPGSWW